MNRLLALLLPSILGCVLAGCPRGGRVPADTTPAGAVQSFPFGDTAGASGIDFVHRTGQPGKTEALNIVQTSGGGCGVLDYDGDGLLDLYLVQGEHTPEPGGGNRLYRNRGDSTYEDVTERAGVRGKGYGMACAVGDYDADGRPDLYVCNWGTNELFRNRGDGTFEEVAKAAGADVKGCSVGAVFADLDEDRRPDLYVARYVEYGPKGPALCTMNDVPTSCGPQQYSAQPGIFLHNLDGKRFQDRTRAAGLVNEGRAMSVCLFDANGDGRSDLYVANDTTADALFLAQGTGKYRDAALEAGVAYGYMGQAEGSMGADAGDYDGDGKADLVVGTMQDRMTLLLRNEGEGLFRLDSQEAGIADITASVVTYGGGFLDYDQDGDLDLFHANGHVQNRIEEINPRVRYHQPRHLFENDGTGKFTDRSTACGPAMTLPAAGRGAAFGDLDNDGDVDLLVNNLDGPPMLLRNRAERLGRHWLRVRLEGKAPNRTPEGALVELKVGERTLVRHLHTTYSYAAANDPRIHFGLGTEAAVGPLRVRWPDGARQELRVAGVDREIVVRQP